MPAFHLSLAVRDLETAVAFYTAALGCELVREGSGWADVSFHGHRLSLRQVSGGPGEGPTCLVDGVRVPVRRFGVILTPAAWRDLAGRLAGRTNFLLTPRSRFVGELGEQHTMLVADPSGNAIELTAYPRGVWT